METALESIKSLPGVSCALFYDPGIGIVSRKSEPDFTEANLSSVGQIVEKFFSWGTELFSDIEQIRLRYDHSTVLVTKPAGSPYLVIVHDAALDANLLEMTVMQAMENPGTNLNVSAAAAGNISAVESAPAGDVEANSQKLGKLLNSEPISQILSGFESALNKVMGPMASIIFSDVREGWISSIDHVSKASFDKLVQMLCAEIGDKDKIKTFRELIAPHIEKL